MLARLAGGYLFIPVFRDDLKVVVGHLLLRRICQYNEPFHQQRAVMHSTSDMSPEAMNTAPLAGITVVELCHSIAGPYAGSILAQLGAEVIKIEHPGKGDDARDWGPPYWEGAAAAFQAMNRDKKGIALNLKHPEELQQLDALIMGRADVVLQNMRPGAVERLGLGAETLLLRCPRLVYCNVGAFGAHGPQAHKPGYDPLMQAQGGLMSVTGEDGREPVRVGTSLVDMGAGMWAAMGVLAALERRHRTGRGGVVDTSLFETSLAWMTVHMAGYLASGEVRRPMGSGIVEIVPHQAFRCSDGFIMVAAGNDALFRKLADGLGMPALAEDPKFQRNGGRVEHRAELIPLLSRVFATQDRAHWLGALDKAGVPVAPLQDIAQVAQDPQTVAVGMVQPVPGSAMTLMGLPLAFDGARPACRLAPPALGEHNAEFLSSSSAITAGA